VFSPQFSQALNEEDITDIIAPLQVSPEESREETRSKQTKIHNTKESARPLKDQLYVVLRSKLVIPRYQLCTVYNTSFSTVETLKR
jgi:hypothetical protein